MIEFIPKCLYNHHSPLIESYMKLFVINIGLLNVSTGKIEKIKEASDS